MAEAGRKQGRTNFAVTCSLLSQYIKDKGSIADLGLGRPQDAAKGKWESFRAPTTMSLLPGADVPGGEDGEWETEGEEAPQGNAMDLFPQRAGFGHVVSDDARDTEIAQLTIFYGGKVLVFDNFPAEKAKDLMQFASKGKSTAQNFGYAPPSSAATVASSRAHSNQNTTLVPKAADTSLAPAVHLPRSAQPILSDLPIARKASLQRFLEKRKDRINARTPYQVTASPERGTHVEREDSKAWLGLGPQLSIPSLSLSSEYNSR